MAKWLKWSRWLLAGWLALAVFLPLVAPGRAFASEAGGSRQSADSGALVYVVPVKQTIESGLKKFLERAFADAKRHEATAIILDMDTLGGRVDAALEIGRLIRESPIPTVSFVHGNAISAGAYLALNADYIVMERASSIGAAAVVDLSGSEVGDAKTISYWSSKMKEAAEHRNRNPQLAIKMVDKSIRLEIPELGVTLEPGQLLTLTATEALQVGYADAILSTNDEVLAFLGLEGATLVQFEPTLAERLARVFTHPVISTLLFIIGLAGIAIELFIPGFGFPGILGVLSFVLYFFGHYVAGFAGVEHIVLFAIGVILFVIEVFAPGFGLWALAGLVCLVSGVVLAAYDTANALQSLGIALVIAVVLVVITAYIFRRRGIWNKFILRDEMTTEQGYVPAESKEYLAGKSGTTVTVLRPAGVVEIGGERIDAVTRGEFIDRGKPVEVVLVEGTRVVVREIQNQNG